jgi:WD40 repeat protein/predicted ATPase/transcriptional regulator with XRE-family HTH domain
MKRSSYRDRDYAFGQAMLTLRTRIGLTQAGLADFLHISRRAVGEWEAGSSYPKVEHIKQLITLGIKQRAFPAGSEAEAIHELWQVSRQKVLLDEHWLNGLLTPRQDTRTTVTPFAVSLVPANKGRKQEELTAVINLPFQPTPFIGRNSEITEISRLLNDSRCRLLTLLGPGGIGKTRLAMEVAKSQTEVFKDGVVFVPLTSIGTPNQIVMAIGEALHLSVSERSNLTEDLLAYLRERQMLLVLDNFEHLLEGADLISDIVQHAPEITLLITSRERLNLRTEWLFDVGGLSYPVSNLAHTLAEISEYSAVQLFVERVMQMQSGRMISEAVLPSVISICQQVVGMPLAIELAAASVRVLPIDEIEQQIGTNLDVLATTFRDIPARHRSMRAVFEQSWNLLSAPAQSLLSRLAVFRGSCTTDAAEKITEAAMPAMIGLVDKSLLRQINMPNAAAEPRFFLLEPIREYALEKLKLRGELEIRQRIHASYYLTLADTATEQWQLRGEDAALEQIDYELDNIRAALQWASGSDVTFGLQLAGVLARFWRSRVYLTEGRMWLESLLSLSEVSVDPAVTRARLRAVNGAGWLAIDLHDFEQATQHFEQGKILRNLLGETDDDTSMLANAGLQARANGQYDRATMLLEDMLARLRALGDRGTLSTGGLGFSLYALALVLREQSDFVRATNLLEECIELHRAINDREAMTQGILGLSDVARDQGDVTAIRKYAEQCLETFREIGTQWAVGFSLNNLAMAAYIEGDFPQAYALVSESLALFRSHKTYGSVAEVLVTMGHILVAQGDLVGADEAFAESLQLAFTIGPRLLVVADLEGLASVMTNRGQAQFAVRFLAVASTLRVQMGTPVRPADQPIVEQSMTVNKQTLGSDTFTAIWSQAEKLPLEQIIRESPFGELLSQSAEPPLTEETPPPAESQLVKEESKPINALAPAVSTSNGHRVDWGDALAIPNFYGREWESSLVKEWVLEERCQVVSILGIGGIGKSALTVSLMHQMAQSFGVVIWRSLRNLPTCEALLEDLLQVLAPEIYRDTTVSFDRRMGALLDQMRIRRTLIVLDNLETVLDEEEGRGNMRPGYEGFAQFLHSSAETKHQSCVLLTSREKPADLIALEGSRSIVRVLRLARLDAEACEHLLTEKGVIGSAEEQTRLIEAYTGNPLALKIVAQTIVDLFDGAIAPFLEQGEVIFGGVRELLSEQFNRLPPLGQSVLLWLAIMREPLTFDELAKILVMPVQRGRLLEAVESLRRRSLIERGVQPGSFTLQSVVLEYLTSLIVEDAAEAIESGKPSRILIEHGFELAQASEYVQETQKRLIVHPILDRLQGGYSQQSTLELQLLGLLDELKMLNASAQGYAPANVVTLLHFLRGNLRRLDLSGLVLRSVYFQGVEMQDTSLASAVIQDSVFNQTFDALSSVAVSSTGSYWAAGSRHGEVRLWTAGGLILHRVWRAHADMVCEMKFSPDGSMLATTGSWDGMLKLWEVASGALIWSVKHVSQAYGVDFSPDGRFLTSTGYDAAVYLWDMQTNTPLHTLIHPEVVTSVIWSPDGRFVVTGDLKGCIRWWAINGSEPVTCTLMLIDHTNCVEGLAFSPDGAILASASWDNTVKLWNVADASVWQTLTAHTDRVTRVAWSPDGHTLVTAGRDQAIWLWDREQVNYRVALYGHSAGVQGLTVTPDSERVLTVSEDGTLRVWNVSDGQSLRLLQGYAASLNDVDWSPDSTQLVSGGSDTLITIYNVNGATEPRILHGHLGIIIGASWSPNGRWIASSEWNNAVRLWDTTSGECIRILNYPDEGDYFDRLAWSPNGQRLAVGTYRHGIQLFDMHARHQAWLSSQIPNWIRHVAWHPDGIRLAGGGADGAVYIWDTSTAAQPQRLTGHHSTITDVAWSPEGRFLASGSRGTDGGELFIWDVKSGERIHTLQGHSTIVYAVAWGLDENKLISGDGEGIMRWWDVQHEACVQVIEAHQGTIHSLRPSPDRTTLASCSDDGAIILWGLETGKQLRTLRRDRPYERLNITGIRGLTEAQKTTLRALGAIEHN